MKIALAQTKIIWEQKQANLEKMEAFLAMTDAEMVVFPEMSLTGFSMRTEVTADQDGATMKVVKELAGNYNKTIGFGWVENAGDLCENHYSIVSPEGEVSLDYVKMHPFSYSGEDRHFRGGDAVSIGKVGDFQTGLAICYDLRFPELFRAMIPQAELILVPANWPNRRSMHWNILLQARAIENQCYVAGVNCCGDMDGQYYSGDSCLFAPDGKKLVPSSFVRPKNPDCTEEGLYIYEIRNDVADVRKAFPVLSDRKL